MNTPTKAVTVAEQSFWIQEQAPAGNFFDSVGLPKRYTLAQAKKQARQWAKFKAGRSVVRLVVRTDVVVQD